ncbi:hypothetical protein TNCV_2059261 [Trichonephila clavipes]|nr:hypothetical protein TNCV_2059261 [Trichonephila clavipes]
MPSSTVRSKSAALLSVPTIRPLEERLSGPAYLPSLRGIGPRQRRLYKEGAMFKLSRRVVLSRTPVSGKSYASATLKSTSDKCIQCDSKTDNISSSSIPTKQVVIYPSKTNSPPRTKSCGRPGLSGMKLCLMVFTFGMMSQRTAPWENWHLERGFELLRIFGLVRWGLGGSGHVEGTGEKLSFASQAAR